MRTILVAGALSMPLAGLAMAEIPPNPGQPRDPGKKLVYGSYIAIAVLLGAVCTAVFKPSKRGHQD